MVATDRKKIISELLEKNGSVRVTELSQMLNISEVTVRNYLTEMESMGLLTRTHGGAISSYKPYCSMNFNQRLETNHQAKDLIGKKIAEMIEPNDTIMLNSGTTTLLAFRHFPKDYNLNIVTNSIAIALEASANSNFNVILVGGSINTKYQYTYGSDAASQLKNYHADKLVLSVDGIDLKSGFSTYYNKEASIDKVMLEQSDICLVAADETKFRRNAFTKICDIDKTDYIITDCKLKPDESSHLYDLGINIINV